MSASHRRSSQASSPPPSPQRVPDSRPQDTPKSAMLGIHVRSPDKEPPLDVIDISSATTAAAAEQRKMNLESPTRESPMRDSPMDEVDITLGESSWTEGGDDDDASTATASKASPVGVHAHLADDALHATPYRPSPGDPNPNTVPRNSHDHPLLLDRRQYLQNNSPPPWEVMQPPDMNNSHRPVVHDFGAKLPTRPLIPYSSYYFGPPPADSAYGTDPIGQIGLHHPREVIRVERDYSGGELIQFAPVYPLELDGRVTPTQFLETINSINELLISAHSLRHSFVDNALAFFSLQFSRLFTKTHYEKEMEKLHQLIDDLNVRLYNPAGLNILWPRKVAFMFLEIEYY